MENNAKIFISKQRQTPFTPKRQPSRSFASPSSPSSPEINYNNAVPFPSYEQDIEQTQTETETNTGTSCNTSSVGYLDDEVEQEQKNETLFSSGYADDDEIKLARQQSQTSGYKDEETSSDSEEEDSQLKQWLAKESILLDQEKCKIENKDIEFVRNIGRGAFGSVWLARYLGLKVVLRSLENN